MRALPDSGPLFRAALFAVWLALACLAAYVFIGLPSTPASTRRKDVPVVVLPELTLEELADVLVAQGVVTHREATLAYLRLLDVSLRTGAVVLNRGLSLRDHLPRIAYGYGSAELQVPIPEGFTRFDVAARLARYGIAPEAELLAAGADPGLLAELGVGADSAEGYLFPAVYPLAQDSAARPVIARMVRVFAERTRARFDAYEAAHAADPLALTPHQLVILASMIEREARVADERRTIAGVFYNRLRDPSFKPRRLQSDPTVAYGCLVARESTPSCAEFDGRRVTPAMVRDPLNPYSTYRREGLPPGPIANPGLASLDAALDPEAHGYFYFVAKGEGRHAFSQSLDAHNQQVRGAP